LRVLPVPVVGVALAALGAAHRPLGRRRVSLPLPPHLMPATFVVATAALLLLVEAAAASLVVGLSPRRGMPVCQCQ